jgi:hypothetical protein
MQMEREKAIHADNLYEWHAAVMQKTVVFKVNTNMSIEE